MNSSGKRMKRRVSSFLIASGLVTIAGLAAPLTAKDSLGIFADWAVFRDASPTRCYAIAEAAPSRLQRDYQPYAAISTWPGRKVRGQVHFRLSRKLAKTPRITLTLGSESFRLIGRGGDSWAEDKRMDASIVARMRSAKSMTIRAVDARGRRFSNSYDLAGAATAMDAATVACAKRG
jgi:hypothetical protein